MKKSERMALREKYEGKCAYCGDPLGERWHADHLNPVVRLSKHIKGKGFVLTGEIENPENDSKENMMPACVPCNIDKSRMSLEDWRQKLQNGPDVLMRNNPTYRHSVRFGLIASARNRVVFFFERIGDGTRNGEAHEHHC